MSLRARFVPILIAAAVLPASSALGDQVIGLTLSNRLVSFDSANPGVVNDIGAISGLGAGENILGIDLRPATGQIIALGSSSTVYFIDPMTAVATAAGAAFTPGLTAGADYSVDINPTVDRLRVVSTLGENRRLNPLNGQSVAPPLDTPLTFVGGGTPRAAGVAYTNSIFNAPLGSTRQFIIDPALDILGETGSQAGGNASFNGGIVTQRGSLGFDTNDLVGFDISGASGLALVSLTDPASNFSGLYSLNLDSAAGQLAATPIGAIGSQLTIRDIAIIPGPGSLALLAVAGVSFSRRRRS